MRDKDRDLIMALAEGTLDAAEAAALERSLDEEGRAELAAQRFALHMMAAAPSPALSDLERERLHVRVLAEGKAEARPVRGRPALLRWTPAWVGGAAVVVAIVAVAAVVGSHGAGDGDDRSLAFGPGQTTITAAAAESRTTLEPDGMLSESQGGGDTVEPGVGAVSSTTVAAAAPPVLSADLSDQDLPALRAELKGYEGPIVYDPASQPCYERLMADDGRPVELAFPGTLAGREVVMFFLEGNDPVGPPLRVYAVDGCEMVESSGE